MPSPAILKKMGKTHLVCVSEEKEGTFSAVIFMLSLNRQNYSFHSKPSLVQSYSTSWLLSEIDISDEMMGAFDGHLSSFPFPTITGLNCGLS